MTEDRVIPNSFQTPNLYVDRAMQHLTDAELRCLIFATRHIFGWQDTIASRQNTISLSMFENGYEWKRKDGTVFMCGGCGLNRTAISKAVNSLCTFGLLEKVGEATQDGQTYHIGEAPKWSDLEKRSAEKREKNCKRVSKATAIIVSKRGGTSDVPVSSDGNSTGTSDVHKQTHIQTQEKDSAQKDSAETRPNIVQFPNANERPRNPVFDAVSEYVFGITSAEELTRMNEEEQAGSRIGMIVSWLNQKSDRFKLGNSKKKVVLGFISSPVKPEHVKMFVDAYKREHNGASAPRDIEKFVEHWRAWASKAKAASAPRPALAPSAPVVELTPEEIEQRRREVEEARKSFARGA